MIPRRRPVPDDRPPRRPARRRWRSALLALALGGLVVLPGCGGDDEPGAPTGSTSDPQATATGTTTGPRADGGSASSPPDETAALARHCTTLLNDRDHATFKAGSDAALALVLATVRQKDEDPGEDRRTAWREALTTARDALVAERDRLAAAADARGWPSVVRAFDDRIQTYEARIAATRSDEWPLSPSSLRLGGTGGVDERALTALGLAERDCARVADEPGPDPRHATFVREAATVCAAIVDRRRLDGFDAPGKVVIGIVAEVAKGERVAVTRERTDALRTLRDEWRRTAGDLARVPTADVPDAAAWRAVVQLARDRAAGYDRRLSAAESGDDDRITASFKDFRRVMGAPGWDFRPLGLQGRDCRALKT